MLARKTYILTVTICNSAVGINKGAETGVTVNTWVCTPVLMTPTYKEKKNKGHPWRLLKVFKHEHNSCLLRPCHVHVSTATHEALAED